MSSSGIILATFDQKAPVDNPGKTYAYLNKLPNLVPGDFVVVSTRGKFQVVKVVQTTNIPAQASSLATASVLAYVEFAIE